jgi:hypothetical protein
MLWRFWSTRAPVRRSPTPIEGHGVAAKLAKYALDFARANALDLVPLCPYVADYIKRHPDYGDLVPHAHVGESSSTGSANCHRCSRSLPPPRSQCWLLYQTRWRNGDGGRRLSR